MADDDPLEGAGTYSQLLFGDDDVVSLSTDSNGCLNFSSSSLMSSGGGGKNSPKMLCFGTNECRDLRTVSYKSGKVTCSEDSSSASSVTTAGNRKSNVNRKRNNGVEKDLDEERGKAANPGNSKKMKAENPNGTSHARAKREKLGDRISALQQLVSPFGKGDTSSVLHEAIGYIKFLQEQVNVLCSPYLIPSSSQSHHQGCGGGENRGRESGGGGGGNNTKDIRSRGLCLVPIDLTLHVAHSNGADFWSPAGVSISEAKPPPPLRSPLN